MNRKIKESDVRVQMDCDRQARHCSRCYTRTEGAPLCDRCARHLRDNCKLVHLAIDAGAHVASGTIANLRRDEKLLAEYDEWKAVQLEAKLVHLPAGPAMLRAAMWRFEEERKCKVTELRVARPGFVRLCRMLGSTWMGPPVRLDAEVRTGHVMLVSRSPSTG